MGIKNDDQIYRKLQQYLDTLPIDHPETESGVEIRVLKHFFTPEEAEIALKLKIIPQEAKSLFRPFKKKNWTLDEFSEKLLTMAKKGSINWQKSDTGINLYGIIPLVIGSYDFQIDKLTKEFAQDFDQYCDEGFVSSMLENGIMQVRTIPIEKSITIEHNISNFDDIKSLIDNIKTTIYVSPCICRQSKEIQGKGCNHPKETCFTFGQGTRTLLDQGREVSKEETLDILQKAQEMGMVLCPSNTQKPVMICCCCACSCMVLGNLKKFENPAQYINSNYFVEVNEDLCNGCGNCVSICPMNANILTKNGLLSEVNLGNCIGCGVCVPNCPENARRLVKKQQEWIPPKNFIEMYQVIANRKQELIEKRKINKDYGVIKKITD